MKAQHQLMLRGIANRLEGEFAERLTRDTLEHLVQDSYRDLSSRATVLTHIPAFVERFTRQRLRSLAKNRGLVTDHTPDVLFYCGRNDAVSQMAAALFAREVGARATVHSAGATPSSDLLEEAVHALHERDIDVLGEFPKPLTPEIEEAADVVVTLDRHDDIPVIDGRQHHAWRMPEHGDDLDAYRALRDDLAERVRQLAAEVVPPVGHRAFDADMSALAAAVAAMGSDVLDLCRRIGPAAAGWDGGELERIVSDDAPVDAAEADVATRVTELIARRQPVAGDLRAILAMRLVALHLERIADGVVDVADLSRPERPALHGQVPQQLSDMVGIVTSMTGIALAMVAEADATRANEVERLDRALEALHQELFLVLSAAHISGVGQALILRLDRISRSLRRAGGHALDIAEQAVFLATAEIVELGRRPHPPEPTR